MNCVIFHTNFPDKIVPSSILPTIHFNCLQLQSRFKYPHHIYNVLIGFYILHHSRSYPRLCSNIETKSQNDKNLFVLMAKNNATSSHWFLTHSLTHNERRFYLQFSILCCNVKCDSVPSDSVDSGMRMKENKSERERVTFLAAGIFILYRK